MGSEGSRWLVAGAFMLLVLAKGFQIRVGRVLRDTSLAATSTSATLPEKSHYVVLDGLRGVASLLVVVFHLFEAFADNNPQKQVINHGYLAVDFFFLLSGFVIAYAYDGRWGSMRQWGFYKRRLMRLQPMIVIGSVVGAALFWFQDYSIYPKLHGASTWKVLLVMLVGFTMIPLPKSADIRGWDETYPLNGPAWSLFYEYVANILYALGVRKLSNRGLSILVGLGAVALIYLAVFGVRGDLVGGWALDRSGIQIGMSRVMFPFFAGVLLMRLGRRIRVKNSFALCSCLLVAALSIPRVGGTEHLWMNGIYESVCVILLFPLIVAIGAGEKREDGASIRIARFFGALSYPLYITHYPLIYIYTGWAIDNHVSALEGTVVGAGVFVASVALAYGCLTFYDIPARRLLSTHLLERRSVRKGASAS